MNEWMEKKKQRKKKHTQHRDYTVYIVYNSMGIEQQKHQKQHEATRLWFHHIHTHTVAISTIKWSKCEQLRACERACMYLCRMNSVESLIWPMSQRKKSAIIKIFLKISNNSGLIDCYFLFWNNNSCDKSNDSTWYACIGKRLVR